MHLVAPKPRDNVSQLTDDELMVLVAGEHKAPFEELVKRHHAVVLGYATRFLGNPSLGREITQEVFLTVWQDRARYKAQGKFRSYLLSVAFNRCQASYRRYKTENVKQSELSYSLDSQRSDEPLERLLDAEKTAFLQRELSHLNERTRQAIILRFCNGLSYDQIGEVTGQRTGTIKSHVCRGIKELLSRLPAEYRT